MIMTKTRKDKVATILSSRLRNSKHKVSFVSENRHTNQIQLYYRCTSCTCDGVILFNRDSKEPSPAGLLFLRPCGRELMYEDVPVEMAL